MPQFIEYNRQLMDWNSKLNLISRKCRSIEDHVLNSVFFLTKVPLSGNESIADIGTGGGFPGIPLKIIYPGIKATLIDSIRKKITALGDIVKELGLGDTAAVCARAEQISGDRKFKNTFDVVTAKAVAPLEMLYDWAKPLVSLNGKMIFIKGGDTGEEVLNLRKRIGKEKVDEIEFSYDPAYGIEQKKIFIISKP